MMSRSMYQFTPEILEFKNVEGKLMVLYDLGTVSEKCDATRLVCNDWWYVEGSSWCSMTAVLQNTLASFFLCRVTPLSFSSAV